MYKVCRALLRDLGTAPDSAQAGIETTVAVILELWHRSCFFAESWQGRSFKCVPTRRAMSAPMFSLIFAHWPCT